MNYEVQHHTLCDGWNTWSDDNGSPVTYDTRQEAEEALQDHLTESQEAFIKGDLAAPYNKDEFRIVPVAGIEPTAIQEHVKFDTKCPVCEGKLDFQQHTSLLGSYGIGECKCGFYLYYSQRQGSGGNINLKIFMN